jgi:hypothetical protein
VVLLVALAVDDLIGAPGLGHQIMQALSVEVVWLGAGLGVVYLVWESYGIMRTSVRTLPMANTVQTLGSVGSVALMVVSLALVASLPITYVIKVTDSEPYPALFQPDFYGPGPLRDARVRQTSPSITVNFTDGSVRRPSSDALIPSPSDQEVEFQTGFYDNTKANEPETVAWLRERLSRLFAHRVPQSMTIDWIETKYDHISGKITFTKLVHVTRVTF